MEVKPMFVHDCTGCEFLGTLHLKGRKPFDAYVHRGSNETYIARFSDEGADYHSLPSFLATPTRSLFSIVKAMADIAEFNR